ncbi:MAG TPA: pentapeptide repeat-containing protein [Solirubrobacteraceae bacterium]|nr:pentapeptide repeat-containing protein [Solirubrobacteraceae bacterium]
MGANLANANLRGAKLVHADLRRADLHHASLVNADLRGADLQQVDLGGADLRGAHLRGVDLLRADLAGAALTRRQLREARLLCETLSTSGRALNRDCARHAIRPHLITASRLKANVDRHHRKHGVRRLVVPVGPQLAGPGKTSHAPAGPPKTAHASNTCAPGVGPVCAYWDLIGFQGPGVEAVSGDFYMTDLDWANLEGANFQGSFIAVAQFDGANLSHANFSHTTPGLEPSTDASTNFNYANLEGINLEGADLRGSQFLDANLRGANLRNTNLDYANLDGARLDGANLEGAYMEGTQFDMASVEEANFLGSFMFQADFANANLTNSLMGVYMESAPAGGFTGQQGSLNLDQAGWTCGTTLPDGSNDSDDCTFTFKLFGELLAGIAESVSGFSFGTVSSSVITAGVRAALEDTTESLGGTAIKLANWALFDGTTSGLQEIAADSPTLGALSTNVLPVIKQIGVKLADVMWKIEAPEGLMSLPQVREYFASHPSTSEHQSVYSPISTWESEWAASLYRYWSTKPAGREYATVAGCTEGEPPECEATTFPARVPNPPSAEVAPLEEEMPVLPVGEEAAAEGECFFCAGFF